MARQRRTGPPEPEERPPAECVICGAVEALTRHHWIPRTLHSRKWFQRRFTREEMRHTSLICRPCHDQIHAVLEEKDLAREYNTLEKLLAHPDISRWREWRKKRIG